jgi:Lon-like ATP-dependent protease
MFKNQNVFLFLLAVLAMIAPWWVRSYYKSDIMFAAFFLGGMMFLAAFVIFINLGRRAQIGKEGGAPKVVVDSFKKDQAPFLDATGAHAGALLGDVLHDPFQSGGLGTPAHERVVAGMIHKANKGVLFIDEIATLQQHTQQELLSALQERKYSITGQSERSAGAMVRTEAVPCDFILVAAGNLETVKHMHPALRSRIRGFGYEIYMKETMPDTAANRWKIAVFVAQEIVKDKKIPHFSKEAVEAIVDEAKRRANRKNHLTLRLRDLGGLVRAAGDLAVEKGAKIVQKEHIIGAKKIARSLEQQIADKFIERKKEYEVIITEGKMVGRVNGLAVIGGEASYSGIILPIESQVTLGGKEKEFVATGKLGEIAKEAVKNVPAIIKKYFGEDIKDYDVYVQFLQTYEGVEGDSASIAVATSIISALKHIPVKQDTAMTGSLSVRGEVLPVGGVSAKVEAAVDAGIKNIIVPKSNMQDIVMSKERLAKIKIIPVETISQVLKQALDWKGKKNILANIEKINGQ